MDLVFDHVDQFKDVHVSYGHFLIVSSTVLSIEDIEFQIIQSAHLGEFRQIF